MESVEMSFWKGRRVFVTGHTGFKGSWLSLWLQQLGAEVTGVALAPPTTPNLFELAQVARGMRSEISNVLDLNRMTAIICAQQPEVVFHLAAQPLVRASYEDPLGTYATNVLGTANLLESVRACDSVRAVVIITTDKCYENAETPWPYRESDRLGGHDPYSSSKACAELVVTAYRRSFFSPNSHTSPRAAIASVRAGNVIGGGDWAQDRLIPDAIRAFLNGVPLRIRNPQSIRPWQHVLEPLRGYLLLAQRLYKDGPHYAEAWNFGPENADAYTVGEIIRTVAELWGPGAQWQRDLGRHPHEAQILRLDWSKAAAHLGWRPMLPIVEALAMTVCWYKAWKQGSDLRATTLGQIEEYSAMSRTQEVTPVGAGE